MNLLSTGASAVQKAKTLFGLIVVAATLLLSASLPAYASPTTTAAPPGGVYNSSQSVTLAANEPATIYYTTNGSTPTTSSSQYNRPLTISYATYLRFFAVNSAGSSETPKTEYFSIDTSPPYSSASHSSGNYVGTQYVSLYCHDGVSAGTAARPCDSTYYCLGAGCAPADKYTSAITIATSTELNFYSTDLAGNRNAVNTRTYTITADIYPPTTSASYPSGAYQPMKVYLNCNDRHESGCVGTYYCLGSDCNPTTLFATSIPISTSADLRFYSVDNLGNKEAIITVPYIIETTTTSTYVSLYPGTYSGAREVSLSCSDYGKGCAATYYCLGSGCTPTTLYSTPVAITTSTALRYYTADKSGNSESVKTSSYTITPDITPPYTYSVYPGGAYRNLETWLYCSDGAGGGCSTTYYCLGTGCTPSTTYNGSIRVDSSTDLRFYSVDRSGNSEAVSTISYVIDKTPPVTTPSVLGGIYANPQSIALSCNDGGGGCANTYYCLGKGCSPDTLFTEPIDISSSSYLSYYSSDSAHNQEVTKTERYTILAASPVTINVPADRATIQAGIDAANDGDTVLVAPGTYMENIDFKGKAITVTSSGGAERTIIDGNLAGAVVTFNSGEWLTSVLDGITIRNGKSKFGMALYGNGGGVSISGSSPLLRNNRIVGNFGCAAVSVGNGSPLIQGNLVANNNLTGCSSSEGGALYLGDGSRAKVIDNTISGNSTGMSGGGGITVKWANSAVIRGNVIRNNSTTGNGGGIALVYRSGAEIVQNVIAGNSAANGGGIYFSDDYYSAIKLTNNTIAANEASYGGGIYFYGNVEFSLLSNNIITAKAGQAAVTCADSYWGSPPQFKNNLVFSLEGSAYDGICTDQSGINGNISADPQLSGATFGYYGLRPGSPAIDSGDNSAPLLPATDMNGAARLIDATAQGAARVDMGAYEFDPFEPCTVVSGAPVGAVRDTTATLLVSGTDIVSYRYAIDGGSISTVDIPVSTPIALSGLTGGRHAVAVVGKTATGEQKASSATVAEWSIDTLAPVTTVTPASGVYTESQTVTLSCNDGTGSGCSATIYCLGGNCTPGTPYTGPITVNSSTGLRYFSQDAFGYQEEIKSASYNFTGVISGKVTDSGTGNPLQGVNVTAYSFVSGASVGYGYTDSAGAYRITGLASGSYKLNFRTSNYVEQWYSGKGDRSTADMVALSAPGAVTGIDSVMVKGGSITGTVTAKDTGVALQGVYVVAYNAASGNMVNSATTDSIGAYSISGLASGDYKINFDSQNSSGYLEQWYGGNADHASASAVSVKNAVVTSGISGVLLKGGSITGKVTDSVSGAPIQSIYVVVYDAVTGSWINSASTDSTGSYSLAGLSGTYKLRFSGSGYMEQWYDSKNSRLSATSVVVTAPSVVTGINMVMVRGGSISGAVTDAATGEAIQWVVIAAYNSTTGLNAGYAITGNGSYSISGLPNGSYKLKFSASGYVDQWYGNAADKASATPVALTAPGSVAGINIALVKGVAISGTVTDKETGIGIQGAYVEVYDGVTGSQLRSGSSDNFGVYSVTGLASGSYKIRFSQSGSGYLEQWYNGKDQKSTATIVEVTVPNGVYGIDSFMEKGAMITGSVTDQAAGTGIQSVRVEVYSTLTGSYVGSGYTDYSGLYSITGLASGSYKLSFNAAGYVSRWFDDKADQNTATTVAVTAPNSVSNINMSMVKGGSISGTVTDRATGAGVADVYLSAFGGQVGSAQSNSAGSYTISGLASGTYRLRIQPFSSTGYIGGWYGGQDGYQCANEIIVTAPNTTTGINAALDLGGSITGRVTDLATGAGLPMASIFLYNSASMSVGLSAIETADSSGVYTLGGLASGEYSLSFGASGYIRTATPTIVKLSAPAAVNAPDTVLTRGGGISGRVTDPVTGEGILGVLIKAVDPVSASVVGSVSSRYNGDYSITGLPNGNYDLYYDASRAGVPATTGRNSMASTAVTAAEVNASERSVTVSTPAPVPIPAPASTPSSVAIFSSVNAPFKLVPLANPVKVTAPEVVKGVDFAVEKLGSISGHVTDSAGNTLANQVFVTVYEAVTGAFAGSGTVDNGGYYTVSGLSSGSYRIKFTVYASNNGGYLDTWYRSASTTIGSSEVTVQSPETTTGIDGRLERGGGISGTVSINSCPAPHTVNVRVYDAVTGLLAGQDIVDTRFAEQFHVGSLPSGSYKLAINPVEPGFMRQWYPHKIDFNSAEAVAVTAGYVTGGIAVSLASGGGSVSGSVVGSVSVGYLPVFVKLYDWFSGGLVVEGSTGHGTSYHLNGLPDSSYKLLFTVNQHDRWYRTAGETAQTSQIVVSGGNAITGIDLAISGAQSGIINPASGKTAPDISDALAVLQHISGGAQLTAAQAASADIAPLDSSGIPQGNGVIDTYDVIGILRMAVGLL